jgi:plasmid stabilization system protein ParE
MGRAFTLRYIPLFEQDITSARDYIVQNLQNPAAAFRLVEETEKAIMKRLENPLGFEPYRTSREHEHTYYRIYVKKFTVFYVVIGNVMEVRRFVYSSRDLTNIL